MHQPFVISFFYFRHLYRIYFSLSGHLEIGESVSCINLGLHLLNDDVKPASGTISLIISGTTFSGSTAPVLISLSYICCKSLYGCQLIFKLCCIDKWENNRWELLLSRFSSFYFIHWSLSHWSANRLTLKNVPGCITTANHCLSGSFQFFWL